MTPNYPKRTQKKVLMRPCLQSLRIPFQPCFLPHFMINEQPCHHDYEYSKLCNISHCERPCCPFAYDPPENDINERNRSQQNEFVEDNRVMEIDDGVTRDVDENRDKRDGAPNKNIQRQANDPPNARAIQDQSNINHTGQIISEVNNNIRNRSTNDSYKSRDDVRDIGTTAAPTTSSKGNQADKSDREENGNNKPVDSRELSLDRGLRQSKLTQANQPDHIYPMIETEESYNNINHRHVNLPTCREKFPEENNQFSSQPDFFSPLATSSMHANTRDGYMTPPEYINRSVRNPNHASNEFLEMSKPVAEKLCINDLEQQKDYQQHAHKPFNQIPYDSYPLPTNYSEPRRIQENRNTKYNMAERRSKDVITNQHNADIFPSNSKYDRPFNPQMPYANPYELKRNMPVDRYPQNDRAERCCIESSNIRSDLDIVPSYSRYPRQMAYANSYDSDPRCMPHNRNPKGQNRAERCCEDTGTNISFLKQNQIPSTSKYPEAKSYLYERRNNYCTGPPNALSNEQEDSYGPTRRNISEKRKTKYGRAERCCEDSSTNQLKPKRIPSRSRCSTSKISLNGKQCYAGSPIVLTNEEDCCCKEGNGVEEYRSRFKKGRKVFRNIVCNCPSDLLDGQVKSSDEPCDRIDANSGVSISPVSDQGPGCRCSYPPSFKQFSCAGNINGSCTCSDNY